MGHQVTGNEHIGSLTLDFRKEEGAAGTSGGGGGAQHTPDEWMPGVVVEGLPRYLLVGRYRHVLDLVRGQQTEGLGVLFPQLDGGVVAIDEQTFAALRWRILETMEQAHLRDKGWCKIPSFSLV